MIVVTGAAGFIGSCLVRRLLDDGCDDVVSVDDFSAPPKKRNLAGKAVRHAVDRAAFWQWAEGRERAIRLIVHLGARTDTTETDAGIFEVLNVAYTQRLWRLAASHAIPLVYASSAAVYGAGEHGFADAHALTARLTPLNAYGRSKQAIDVWAVAQGECPPSWVGLRFFNVYGPNEGHKGRMASVACHGYHQIAATGAMRLFRSHRADVVDGGQRRDFVYVDDVIAVIRHFMASGAPSGIYNVGTGRARTFNELAAALFHATGCAPRIEWVDTPAELRETYQYFTEADLTRLRAAGYAAAFTTLEDGVADYVTRFLRPDRVA